MAVKGPYRGVEVPYRSERAHEGEGAHRGKGVEVNVKLNFSSNA